MKIVVLPVSGGAFPNQLAILSQLCDANYRPDIVLGSSGGNICSYIALAADWKSKGIERIAHSMSSSFFIDPWIPDTFLPSWFLGFFKGSIYKSSDVTIDYFSELFCPGNIIRNEIWTGTANWQTGQPQLFCNVSEDQAKIKFKRGIFESLPHIYLDGEVEKICKASIASAAIPSIVPLCDIDSTYHCDGGVFFSSPLPCLSGAIQDMGDEYHLTYISPRNLGSPIRGKSDDTLSGRLHELSNLMVRGSALYDRSLAVSMIKGLSEYEEGEANVQKIRELEEQRNHYKQSLIEYYPMHDDSLLIHSFEGEDILGLMEKTKSQYRYRMWV